jgi:hypothetical protein
MPASHGSPVLRSAATPEGTPMETIWAPRTTEARLSKEQKLCLLGTRNAAS